LADKTRNTCYTFLAGFRQRKAPFFHEDIAMNSPLRRLGLACFIAAAIPLGGCLGEEGSTSEGTFSFQVGAQSVVIIVSPRDSESGLVSGQDTTVISPRDSESGLVSGQDTAIVSPRDTESGLPTGKR
jgi:hypothetical protein